MTFHIFWKSKQKTKRNNTFTVNSSHTKSRIWTAITFHSVNDGHKQYHISFKKKLRDITATHLKFTHTMDSGGLVNDSTETHLSKHIAQEENHIMSQSNIMNSSGQKSQQWREAVEL